MNNMIPNKVNLILPLGILLIFAPITLYQPIVNELDSGWVRAEFYLSIVINILFLIGIAYYTYKNCMSGHWTNKYLVNFGIIISLILYYQISLSYDAAFPTLGLLTLLAALISVFLLILQSVATLIKKLTSKTSSK